MVLQSTKGRAYYALTLLSMLYMFDYADRMVMSSLLPYIKADWGSSDAELAMLTGVVSLFVALFVLPMSVLVDRWSRKKMIVIMTIFWSLATLACAFARDYNELLALRALTGLGEAAYAPAAVALISKLFPRNYRAYYTGIFDSFAPLGAGIGFAIGGYVGLVYGWRHAFGMVAAPGIIIGLLFLLVRDYKTVPLLEEASGSKHEGSFAVALKSTGNLFKIRTLWFVYLAYALNIAVNTSIMIWSPSYFVRVFGFDEKTAGTMAGGIAMLVLIGAPLGGFVADRWHKSNKSARLYVSAASSLLGAVFLLLSLQSSNITMALIYFALFGVSTVVYLAPATAVIQDVVQPGIRAVAYGVNVVIMNILGAFLAPVTIGWLSDRYGLANAFYLLPVLGLCAMVLFIGVRKQYLRDSVSTESLE